MNYITTDSELISIASAIRTKTGASASLVYPSDFVNAITSIPTGTDTSDATATANDILYGQTAYASGVKLTGTIQSYAQDTWTPSSNTQTIPSGYYLSGAQVIEGDQNLISENIKAGTSIFGVEGSYSGGEPEKESVIFIDYDGTVLYSYTPTQFAALSEMPANPSHEGLTAQGWNWDLEEAQGHVEIYKELIIGQQYLTSDGKTRIYIKIDNEELLSLYLGIGVVGTCDIDWGDGSTHSTLTGTSFQQTKFSQHIYSSIGNYVIALDLVNPSQGEHIYLRGVNNGASHSQILNKFGTTDFNTVNYNYLNLIYGIEMGEHTYFQDYAISNCANLSFITINPTASVSFNQLFANCRSLSAIVIPQYSPYIYMASFKYCYRLKIISLPAEISSIYSDAFQKCYALQNITLPSNLENIQSYAFSDCTNLSYITLPSILTAINASTFQNCTSLSSIIIPSNIGYIYDQAFQSCSNLSSISLSNVTHIGTKAFSSCYSLQTINLPSSLLKIGSYQFAFCSALSSVDVGGASKIESYAFYGCTSLRSINNSSNINYFATGAFRDCSNLIFDLPSTTTGIGPYIFYNCINISKITLPSTVTQIDYNGFQYTGLVSVTIPSSITKIGNYAFQDCKCLEKIRFEGETTIPSVNLKVWSGVPSTCKVQVPYTALASYLSAPSYPAPSSYTYYGFATYPNQTTLPTQDSTQAYNVVWYGTLDDAAAQSSAITIGNGNEIYCRYTSVT